MKKVFLLLMVLHTPSFIISSGAGSFKAVIKNLKNNHLIKKAAEDFVTEAFQNTTQSVDIKPDDDGKLIPVVKPTSSLATLFGQTSPTKSRVLTPVRPLSAPNTEQKSSTFLGLQIGSNNPEPNHTLTSLSPNQDLPLKKYFNFLSPSAENIQTTQLRSKLEKLSIEELNTILSNLSSNNSSNNSDNDSFRSTPPLNNPDVNNPFPTPPTDIQPLENFSPEVVAEELLNPFDNSLSNTNS